MSLDRRGRGAFRRTMETVGRRAGLSADSFLLMMEHIAWLRFVFCQKRGRKRGGSAQLITALSPRECYYLPPLLLPPLEPLPPPLMPDDPPPLVGPVDPELEEVEPLFPVLEPLLPDFPLPMPLPEP